MTQGSSIGRSVRRLDGGEKVTGLTRFAGDLQLPRMLHARLVLSPHAHARIARVDGSEAAGRPGVLGVFAAADLGLANVDPTARSKSPLALGHALFVGHPVAAVVAETAAIAEDAAALVEVEYEPLPAALDARGAMRLDAPRVRAAAGAGGEAELAMHGAATGGEQLREAVGPNVVSTQRFHRGDLARGFAEADVVVERRFETPMVHQGYLEPRAVVADVDPLGALTIWTATQALFFTRSEVCEALGLPEHRVRIVATPLGGGFGAKFVLLEPLAGALALRLRRPVSVVMTRTGGVPRDHAGAARRDRAEGGGAPRRDADGPRGAGRVRCRRLRGRAARDRAPADGQLLSGAESRAARLRGAHPQAGQRRLPRARRGAGDVRDRVRQWTSWRGRRASTPSTCDSGTPLARATPW